MTTPERTVEEIAQAIYFKVKEMQRLAESDTETILCVDAIKTILQAERQKREEMVEVERQRICKDIDEMWSLLYGAYLNNQDLKGLIKDLVTQPNNPK